MTALIVIAAILTAILLLSLFRGGADAEYSDDGFCLNVFFGPVKIHLVPSGNHKKRTENSGIKKKTEKKSRLKQLDSGGSRNKKKKHSGVNDIEKKNVSGGSVKKILAVLPTACGSIRRFLRFLSIDVLTLHYTFASDDPYKTAVRYGAAESGLSAFCPIIKQLFHIKKWNVSTDYDFTSSEDKVYLKVRASIAVWQVIYIICKLDFKAIISLI